MSACSDSGILPNIQTLTIETFFDASEGKVVEVLDKVIILAAMRVNRVAKAVSVKGLRSVDKNRTGCLPPVEQTKRLA